MKSEVQLIENSIPKLWYVCYWESPILVLKNSVPLLDHWCPFDPLQGIIFGEYIWRGMPRCFCRQPISPPAMAENKQHHLLGHAVDYRRRNWTWAWESLTNLTQAGPSKNCRGIFEIVSLECYQLPGKTTCSKKLFLVLLSICWRIKAALFSW